LTTHSIELTDMVQGSTKGLKAKTTHDTRHAHKAAANTKKGRRTIAPKKAAAIKQASMHQVSHRSPTFLSPFPCMQTRLNGDAGTQRQDQQVRRTTDGERRIIRQAHDHENCRHGHGEVSASLHCSMWALVVRSRYFWLLVSFPPFSTCSIQWSS